MPLSVDAPLMYVRPSISGSIRSPEPKCLSSLLLEALLERVLLLEWLEFLSPAWHREGESERGEGERNSKSNKVKQQLQIILTDALTFLPYQARRGFTHQASSHGHVSLTEATACFLEAHYTVK